MRKPILVSLAASTTLLSLTGCGHPVRLNGVTVDKAVPFVNVIEQAWRDQIAGDSWVAKAPTTHCWLPRDRKTGAIDMRAFCGPVRHLSTNDKPGVFDVMTFTATIGQDGQVAVDPQQVSWVQSGAEAPGDKTLYHPSGDKPAGPGEVPAPPAPAAQPGTVQLTAASLVEARQPTNGLIIVPGYRIAVEQVGRVETLPGQENDPFYLPAQGEEFLGIQFNVQPDADYLPQSGNTDQVDTSIAYSVKSGDTVTALDLSDHEGSADGGATGQTIVVSVPAGGDAQLIVGVAGVEQAFSIRTGERISTTAEGNYRTTRVVDLQKQYATRTVSKGDFSITHGVTFTQAYVSGFDPRRGWAPDGYMYVSLRFANGAADQADYHYAAATFNRAKTLRFGDKSVKVLDPSPVEQVADGWTSDGEVSLLVPTALHDLHVTYGPQGTFALDDTWIGSDDVSPKSGSFKMKPLTFKIDLN